MKGIIHVGIYLIIGTLGGLLGSRVKVSGSVLISAMLAIIAFKMITRVDWTVPRGFGLGVQILLGVMVGVTYSPEMGKVFLEIALPLIFSTLILVASGMAICILLVKMGFLDISTAYLATSPGAMTVLTWLAIETGAHPTVVAAFHFFRIVFIILTVPLVFYLLRLLGH